MAKHSGKGFLSIKLWLDYWRDDWHPQSSVKGLDSLRVHSNEQLEHQDLAGWWVWFSWLPAVSFWGCSGNPGLKKWERTMCLVGWVSVSVAIYHFPCFPPSPKSSRHELELMFIESSQSMNFSGWKLVMPSWLILKYWTYLSWILQIGKTCVLW